MNDAQKLEEFGRKFWRRFQCFRDIEVREVFKGPFRYSGEAFALLHDIELCYAAKAYFACIVLAHSIIEAHLRRVENMEGWAAQIFKQAGIREEISWLTMLRNDIIHGNSNDQVKYGIYGEDEVLWEDYCVKAFTFMHELPIRLEKLRANG